MHAAPLQAYLLCGPSLAGKSTAAAALSRAFDAGVVCADRINEERGLPFGAEGLPESTWAETLRIQLERMRQLAASGRSVIADDSFCYRWLRDRHRDEARAAGLQPVLLLLAPGEAELWSRHAAALAARSRPVLGVERFADHLARFEWPGADEQPIDITTPRALAGFIAARCRKDLHDH